MIHLSQEKIAKVFEEYLKNLYRSLENDNYNGQVFWSHYDSFQYNPNQIQLLNFLTKKDRLRIPSPIPIQGLNGYMNEYYCMMKMSLTIDQRV